MSKSYRPALPHGSIEQIFDDIYMVSGAIQMAKPKMSFSRNMVILRHGESLTLVNTLRLDEAGLEVLDGLGKVEHVVRLAGFHGRDDPFYADHYGAKVWVVKGQFYAKGFDIQKGQPERPYFEPHGELDESSELPWPQASLLRIDGAVPEGLLHLDRDGGILISGDTLQNWHRTDEFFSGLAKVMMKLMGFIKPHNVGPGWLKGAKPSASDVKRILDLEFEHVLPSHGANVLGGAKASFTPSIERALRKLS